MAHNLGRELLEQRQQLVAHPRPQEARAAVRRILGEGEAVTRQMRRDRRLARAALRANPDPRARGNTDKPLGPEPRSKRNKTVSARSSAWCAVAISSAWTSAAATDNASRRASRARACRFPPFGTASTVRENATPSARPLRLGAIQLCCSLAAQPVIDAVREQQKALFFASRLSTWSRAIESPHPRAPAAAEFQLARHTPRAACAQRA